MGWFPNQKRRCEMTKSEASIIDWGTPVRPTKAAVKQFEFDKDSYAICFGLNRHGYLVVVREGCVTLEDYHARFWDILPTI